MKLAIRALGWTTYILWLILIVFTVTAIYSASQLNISFDEPQWSVSGGTMTLSLPFSLNNTGFYDVSNLNISTLIRTEEGLSVSNSSTFVPLIASGSRIYAMHNISVSLDDLTSDRLSHLLFNDTVLGSEMSIALTYATVIPFKISTNLTMPWGAPLSNLTIRNPYFTDSTIVVPTSFENHSFFNLTGTMRLELVNNLNQQVGAEIIGINVPPRSLYSNDVAVSVSGPMNIKEVRIYFHTSVLSYGPVVIPLA